MGRKVATVEITLIDGIGPFFRGYDARRINWSKIPFAHLAMEEPGRAVQWAQIREDMRVFAEKVASLGYNAVSLDDVAHLARDAWHEPDLQARIEVYREEFRKVFAVLRECGLHIYITTDYLTTSSGVEAQMGKRAGAVENWHREWMAGFLDDFPEVSGVILRIGESDGQDVEDTLRSRLLLRSAKEVNRFLKGLLPVFEARERRLIFRTWTVGAFLIGDLIWHRGRLAQALEGIGSRWFVLSMKYGESDFFRYLPLNRHFFRIALPKIIELQARREYEGAGEYPAFIGWDCEQYARELAGAQNVVGLSMWCQTGGWHAFRRLAFLQPEARWIELNAAVALAIFQKKQTVEEAVAAFFGEEKAAVALELLRRTEAIVRELLYVEEFAMQKLFFRRVRIPPLLHVYWDCVFINDPVRKVLGHFVLDPEGAVRQGEAVFENFPRLIELMGELGLPPDDIEFMRDTMGIILLARRYYFLAHDEALIGQILAAKKAYKERWPRPDRQRYRIRTSFEPLGVRTRTTHWLFKMLVRRQRGYRTLLDRIFTIHVLSWIYRLFRRRHQDALPKILRKTAMGVDSLFR